jgi:hypothetical protein
MKKVILISLISLFANTIFAQCDLKVRIYVANETEHLNALTIANDTTYVNKMEFEIICVNVANDFPKDIPVVKVEYFCAKTDFKLATVYSHSTISKYEISAYAFESKRILNSIKPYHYENVGYLKQN